MHTEAESMGNEVVLHGKIRYGKSFAAGTLLALDSVPGEWEISFFVRCIQVVGSNNCGVD
jgi:hypothetical protein